MTVQARIINHEKKVWPSGVSLFINLGHYEAEQVGMQAVNAQWLWEHPQADGFIYSPSKENHWTRIAGVDCLRNGSKIILETGRCGERLVEPDYTVYVAKATITEAV